MPDAKPCHFVYLLERVRYLPIREIYQLAVYAAHPGEPWEVTQQDLAVRQKIHAAHKAKLEQAIQQGAVQPLDPQSKQPHTAWSDESLVSRDQCTKFFKLIGIKVRKGLEYTYPARPLHVDAALLALPATATVYFHTFDGNSSGTAKAQDVIDEIKSIIERQARCMFTIHEAAFLLEGENPDVRVKEWIERMRCGFNEQKLYIYTSAGLKIRDAAKIRDRSSLVKAQELNTWLSSEGHGFHFPSATHAKISAGAQIDFTGNTLDREYFSITDAAKLTKLTVDDLLHFGASNRLPIYALLPMLPLLKYDKVEFPEDDLPFGDLMTTSGPVRMETVDVATLEGGGEPDCHFFCKVDFATGKECRYLVRRHGPGLPLDTIGKGCATVRRENLRIMARDIEAILRSQASAESKPDSETAEPLNDVSAVSASENQEATAVNGTASQACKVFRDMDNLKPYEVSIDFAAGESGGVILNISARRVLRRVALGDIELYDRRKAQMNEQCALLLGMAKGKSVTNSDNARSRQISRIRKIFSTHLGISDDPFLPCRDSGSYSPIFKISDSRGTADERAKREAERRTVPHEDNNFYEAEDDEAGKWIRDNNNGEG